MPRTQKKQQVEFRVDVDQIADMLTIDEMVAMSELFSLAYQIQDQSPENALPALAAAADHLKTTRGFLCKLVWNGDGYLDPADAAPVVGQLTLRQLIDTLTGIMTTANETAHSDAEAGGQPVE